MRTGFSLPTPTILWRRFQNTLRTVFTRGDFSTLIITCLLMLIPVLALNAALSLAKDAFKTTNAWPVSLGELIPVAILSVIFGFLLSRSHYSEALSLLMSGIYGVAVIGLIQYINAPEINAQGKLNIAQRNIQLSLRVYFRRVYILNQPDYRDAIDSAHEQGQRFAVMTARQQESEDDRQDRHRDQFAQADRPGIRRFEGVFCQTQRGI